MNSTFWCAFCFQENPVWVDLSGGSEQRYVEDCQVCCRPNRLTVWIRESDAFTDDDDQWAESEASVTTDVIIDIESEPTE